MKLLNCSTLRIEEMHWARKQELEDQGISTAYAILSHRWESDEDEVTFEDMASADIRSKKLLGWSKIEKTCAKALEIGIGYAWIDTCCIDKRNLTELTEAINSMFRWYAEAEICFAYLSDVGRGGDLAKSMWFTRGWTLQELIAPGKMEFYDKNWNAIGSRFNLSRQIQMRTSINAEILRHDSSTHESIQDLLAGIPVGRRMSWAAGRQAKKEEDRAYSLLGIFGVSMPLLYGEGNRAFIRLQEEIIKETNDMSLFAWCDPTVTCIDDLEELRGILTTTPDHFRGCCNLTFLSDPRRGPEFSMTNKGLRLESKLFAFGEGLYFLGLGCRKIEGSNHEYQGILLHQLSNESYVRTRPERLYASSCASESRPFEKKVLFIAKEFNMGLQAENLWIPGRNIKFCIDDKRPKLHVMLRKTSPFLVAWISSTLTFESCDLWEFEGAVEIKSGNGIKFTLIFGFDAQHDFWIYRDEKALSGHWMKPEDYMPAGHGFKVEKGLEDGIPTIFIHLFRTEAFVERSI
ncbi:HET domain-containing protein [Colletotrichum scovillei]|uniref:HET domain-containing protein n=1 Tax=Colletotrichum scovillei TaxID=1209932 RepID=A0A9P7UGX7_9PEZI|nr:HET domain-containing protein [Colletotrichum scovillei]KAF4774182.1 HET domain-containing protein [Colletotrichum scovillei]KAG7055989.1 HET domain-containing protein [Colletotrichum scovillei]KAG7075433.1 HET domain-containing protein [Colletotrichum scovillei]KAG7082442.1 HET domain-containing protein [Colletotrichum scovillei]